MEKQWNYGRALFRLYAGRILQQWMACAIHWSSGCSNVTRFVSTESARVECWQNMCENSGLVATGTCMTIQATGIGRNIPICSLHDDSSYWNRSLSCIAQAIMFRGIRIGGKTQCYVETSRYVARALRKPSGAMNCDSRKQADKSACKDWGDCPLRDESRY